MTSNKETERMLDRTAREVSGETLEDALECYKSLTEKLGNWDRGTMGAILEAAIVIGNNNKEAVENYFHIYQQLSSEGTARYFPMKARIRAATHLWTSSYLRAAAKLSDPRS